MVGVLMSELQAHSVRRFPGLSGSVNPFDAVEGAAEISDNCTSRSADVLESRRGFSAVASTSPLQAIGYKQGRLLALTYDDGGAQYPGALQSYDPVNGFVAFAMSPGALTIGKPRTNARSRFVSVNKSAYFQSQYGLTKIDDVATAKCRCALQPRALVNQNVTGIGGLINGTATAGGTAWLATGNQVAYRFTIARRGANNEVIESEPTERIIISNTTGSAGYVALQVQTGWMMAPDAYWRVWRSTQVANGTDPSDEMFLVAEMLPLQNYSSTEGWAGALGNVAYNDYSSDGSIYIPLYTNPITGNGIAQADAPAPLSSDLFFFKRRLYYFNTSDVQRLVITVIGTGTGGIQAGDTITINGVVFTFVTSNAGTRNILLSTGGTVAQNIINTAVEIGRTVNYFFLTQGSGTGTQSVASRVQLSYLGSTSTAPGQILIQSIIPGVAAFSVKTSSRNGWDRDYTVSVSSDPNTQVAGLMWSSLDQPEAVPLANNAPVGDASLDGQRGIALKEAALLFKKDGLFRVTDDGSSIGPVIGLADPTVRLIAPETAVALNNFAIALCDQGVTLFTENGASTNLSHDSVERELLKLVATVGNATMASVAYAVAYELEHLYVLCLPESSNATACTLQYVFNLQTRVWTRWRLPGSISGLVYPDTGQLCMGMGINSSYPSLTNALWLERKSFDSTDYQDPSYSIASPATTIAATMVFAGDQRSLIAVGDMLVQVQATNYLQQRVTAVTYSSANAQTTVTLDAAPRYAWTSASLTIVKGVNARVRFLPFHAGQPLVVKEWRDVFLSFRYLDADFIQVSWASPAFPTDNSAMEQITGLSTTNPAPPVILQAWAPVPWAQTVWGRQTRDIVAMTSLPLDFGYAAQLVLTLAFSNALSRWELSAIDTKIAGTTDRVVR
jgi:hypothetical protein